METYQSNQSNGSNRRRRRRGRRGRRNSEQQRNFNQLNGTTSKVVNHPVTNQNHLTQRPTTSNYIPSVRPKQPNTVTKKVNNESSDKCGICFENVKPRSNYGLLEKCEHKYCLSCIDNWRNSNQTQKILVARCPICRIVSDLCVSSSNFLVGEAKRRFFDNYKRLNPGYQTSYLNVQTYTIYPSTTQHTTTSSSNLNHYNYHYYYDYDNYDFYEHYNYHYNDIYRATNPTRKGGSVLGSFLKWTAIATSVVALGIMLTKK